MTCCKRRSRSPPGSNHQEKLFATVAPWRIIVVNNEHRQDPVRSQATPAPSSPRAVAPPWLTCPATRTVVFTRRKRPTTPEARRFSAGGRRRTWVPNGLGQRRHYARRRHAGRHERCGPTTRARDVFGAGAATMRWRSVLLAVRFHVPPAFRNLIVPAAAAAGYCVDGHVVPKACSLFCRNIAEKISSARLPRFQ